MGEPTGKKKRNRQRRPVKKFILDSKLSEIELLASMLTKEEKGPEK